MDWRFLAMRATTREWLDLDVPLDLDDGSPSWALSGPGALKGFVAPDYGQLRAPDGGLVLEEWGTLIFAEANGIIRWGGIVVSSGFEGPKWTVEAASFPAYLAGMPYVDLYSRVNLDPLDAARELWRHVQEKTDGDLALVVDGDKSPIRLGKAAIPAYYQVCLSPPGAPEVWVREDSVDPSRIDKATKAALAKAIDANDTTLTIRRLKGFGTITPPFTISIGNEKIRVQGRTGLKLTGLIRGWDEETGTAKPGDATGHNKGTAVKFAGTPRRKVEKVPAEPYSLAWWEAPDCGQEFDRLAQETPFDYYDTHAWDGDTITHRLVLGYPRVGRKRTDLAFVQGENISQVVTPTRDGEGFANGVWAIGKGEGSKAKHRTAAVRDGRLRRIAIYADKSVNREDRLATLARSELNRRQRLLEISSVEVMNHPHAPIGSWSLGDDVLIQATLPWLGRVSLWCRVVGWSLLGTDRARLDLKRSDSFTYAPPPET